MHQAVGLLIVALLLRANATFCTDLHRRMPFSEHELRELKDHVAVYMLLGVHFFSALSSGF